MAFATAIGITWATRHVDRIFMFGRTVESHIGENAQTIFANNAQHWHDEFNRIGDVWSLNHRFDFWFGTLLLSINFSAAVEF